MGEIVELPTIVPNFTDEQSSTHRQDSIVTTCDAKSCADIIHFRHNGKAYHDRALARALPNQRLVTVFGINNSFTNTDAFPGLRSSFRRTAVEAMNQAV